MGITIIKKTSTANTTYFANRKLEYIVVHYTAGVYSYKGVARNCASMFGDPSFEASADFIVDDGEIVQYNGDIKNRYTWAVGGSKLGGKGGSCYGKCTNANSISIEMCCVNSSGNMTQANDQYYSLTDATVKNCEKLVKHLMEEYGIPASRVIRHYDVTGKLCPGVKGWNEDSGDTSKWQAFKKTISAKDNKSTTTDTNTKKVTPYIVRTSKDLPIYKTPATNATVNKICPKGAYTIVAEKVTSNVRFGNLKAGGWINLAYATKVSTTSQSTVKKLTTKELAYAIIRGEWSAGDDRVKKLKAAGYSETEIAAAQSMVNTLMR